MRTYKCDSRLKVEDIRKMALDDGMKDNKVSIGVWAQTKGFIKKQSKDKDKRNYYYYVKDN